MKNDEYLLPCMAIRRLPRLPFRLRVQRFQLENICALRTLPHTAHVALSLPAETHCTFFSFFLFCSL